MVHDSDSSDFEGTHWCEDSRLGFDEVFREELHCLRELRELRTDEGQPRQPFSLAFSGGGIRAAAFQAGVLWRLAQEDRLKDVDYLAAVSGGGYVASAFASHCLSAPPPSRDGCVRSWYLEIVAKTICRMQANAGDFVRDCAAEPGVPKDGAGCLPRLLDLPVLLVAVFFALVLNPLMFVICFLIPFTICIELCFGAALRSAFCAAQLRHSEYDNWIAAFWKFSPLSHLLLILRYAIAATFAVYAVAQLMPCCRLKRNSRRPRSRPSGSIAYMLGYAATACLKRFTIGLIILIAFLFMVPWLQVEAYDVSMRRFYCLKYIEQHRQMGAFPNEEILRGPLGALPPVQSPRCSDRFHTGATPWYWDQDFDNLTLNFPPGWGRTTSPVLGPKQFNAFAVFWSVLFTVSTCGVCLLPIIGVKTIVRILSLAGPMFLLLSMASFVQYAVYGPITGNHGGMKRYDKELWEKTVTWALTAAMVLMPFSSELRSVFHLYYKRSLQVNFFEAGKDHKFSKLAKCPYCPFLILTGTCSDYAPPGETDGISELSLSALHFGGEKTGYARMPRYRSLAKCAAISGAGAFDAISLSMSKRLSMRFWLEVLNLSWGDFIIFDHYDALSWTGIWKANITRMLHRFPVGIVHVGIYVLLFLMWNYEREQPEVQCNLARKLFAAAMWITLTVFVMSFFTFVPFVDLLTLSPLIRQAHQATQYLYVGERPPRMLYMTDGGVKDCTAISQLLLRRRERILLVLAAADPDDELQVLRAAIEEAVRLRLANFYDPADPEQHLDVLFETFRTNPEMRRMRIGIRYCWGENYKSRDRAVIVVVKNRLPPSLSGKPVRPLLTEDRICHTGPSTSLLEGQGAVSDSDAEDPATDLGAFEELATDDLGPLGCCDCCHTQGLNWGPKFPHGTFTGYLWLSPQWFNGLVRLGYAMCEGAPEDLFEQCPAGEAP